MTELNPQLQSHEINAAIRERILARAKAVNGRLLGLHADVIASLNEGHHREALALLDDLVSRVDQVRTILSLLEKE